jgi:hypothetical protein
VKGIMGAHRSSPDSTDEWLTPPELLSRLGPFDLDPCTPLAMPWSTAARRYTPEDDGLTQPWAGRVWLNPPYGAQTGRWLRRLATHGDGIALVFARTETSTFFRWVWPKADALLFIRGRLAFRRPDGSPAGHNSGGPSVLVAYGVGNYHWLRDSGIGGTVVRLTPDSSPGPLFG